MTVFADTFALIAWVNPRDYAHERVANYLSGFTGRLVTTEWNLPMHFRPPTHAGRQRPFFGPFDRTHCSTWSATTLPSTKRASTSLPAAPTKPGR
jgi:hypothetical protein